MNKEAASLLVDRIGNKLWKNNSISFPPNIYPDLKNTETSLRIKQAHNLILHQF